MSKVCLAYCQCMSIYRYIIIQTYIKWSFLWPICMPASEPVLMVSLKFCILLAHVWGKDVPAQFVKNVVPKTYTHCSRSPL